jgi:hypothetical protein
MAQLTTQKRKRDVDLKDLKTPNKEIQEGVVDLISRAGLEASSPTINVLTNRKLKRQSAKSNGNTEAFEYIVKGWSNDDAGGRRGSKVA